MGANTSSTRVVPIHEQFDNAVRAYDVEAARLLLKSNHALTCRPVTNRALYFVCTDDRKSVPQETKVAMARLLMDYNADTFDCRQNPYHRESPLDLAMGAGNVEVANWVKWYQAEDCY